MEDHEGMRVADSHQETVSRVREAMLSRGLTQRDVARQIDEAEPRLSTLLAGKFKGRPEEIVRKLDLFLRGLDNADRLGRGLEKVGDYVETPTAIQIEGAYTFARARGAIVVVAGASGVGKSKSLMQAPRLHPAVWYCQLSRKHGETPNATVAAIGRALDLFTGNDGNLPASRVSQSIVDRLSRTRGLLIVDEAQHMRRDSFEQVRWIFDACQEGGSPIGLVLAGHLDLMDKVAALPQLDGRVAFPLRLPSAKPGDVDALCAHWEVGCARARSYLRDKAGERSGLRRVAKVIELALGLAARDGQPVAFDHVRSAWQAFSGATVH